MGNPDKIVIFNRSFGILVRGRDYWEETEIVPIALKQFEAEARHNIEVWRKTKEQNPEQVYESYRPEYELEVRSIEVYDVHN